MRWLNLGKSATGKKSGKAGNKAKGARRRPMPRWAKRSVRGGVAVAIFSLALAGPTWLWQSGWVTGVTNSMFKAAAESLADAGFRVEEVMLEGRANESSAQIMKALDISRGAPLTDGRPEICPDKTGRTAMDTRCQPGARISCNRAGPYC